MNDRIHLTKLDVARRQLAAAVLFYFNNGDPIAIHTLAAASHQVLRDLNRHAKLPRMHVKDEFIDQWVPDGLKAEVRRNLNAAENFFKHGDRDPNETLEFAPRLSEIFILDSIRGYQVLTGEAVPLFQLFEVWLLTNKPDTFQFQPEHRAVVEIAGQGFHGLTRRQFLTEVLPLLHALHLQK